MIDFLVCLGHIAIGLVVNYGFLWILDHGLFPIGTVEPDDDTVMFVSFFSGQAALITVIPLWSLLRWVLS